MSVPQLRRSQAAVQQLERLQAQDAYRSGDERKPEEDARVLRETAKRTILAEYLAAHQFASVEETTAATVDVVDDPSFAADVEERVRKMECSFQTSDGDIWSRYERPDRRKRLSDLVVRVEGAAAKRGHQIPRRPVVGTLPTYDINARALPGPTGEGHLVVFESGMFSFSSVLGKLAAQAIDAQFADDGTSLRFSSTPPAIADHLAGIPQILYQFGDLLFSQAVLGTSAYTAVYQIPPQNTPIANQLTDGIDTFVLAHEYGHVILGHADVHGAGPADGSKNSHEQEFEADRIALEICTAAWGGELWAYAGASLFFSALDAVDKAAATFLTGSPELKPSESHPSAAERRHSLSAALQRSADPAVVNGALRMAEAMEWVLKRMGEFMRPAFEKAYRGGYPHAGFRARNEYEKVAALQAFMAEGLGFGYPQEPRT